MLCSMVTGIKLGVLKALAALLYPADLAQPLCGVCMLLWCLEAASSRCAADLSSCSMFTCCQQLLMRDAGMCACQQGFLCHAGPAYCSSGHGRSGC